MTPSVPTVLPVPAKDAPRSWSAWTGRRVLVLGAARSGRAAARLLAERGLPVTLADGRSREVLGDGDGLDALEAHGVRIAAGRDDAALLDGADIVVTSPGVPPTAALLAAADKRGVPVVAELELAFQASRAPWVAITGTNGKSTTTALAGRLVAATGRETFVCGNIGEAACERAAAIPPDGAIVAEVSSFQLERVVAFKPVLALVTNLTPDHLDRHGDLATYAALKSRVFAQQDAGDRAVLNADDPATADWATRFGLAARVGYVRASDRPELAAFDGALLDGAGRVVRVREGHRDVLLPARALKVPGPHNVMNALCAVAATLPWPAPIAALATELAAFPGLEHRIEAAGTVGGVRFWNDSKATNVDSMRTALLAFPAPVVVIAGGRDKAGPWASIATLAAEKIGRLILIGEAAPTIAAAWPAVPAERATDLDDAVRRGYAAGRALGGAPVVLSPGCASFDMFTDYEDRGRRFKAAVTALVATAGGEGA